MWGLLAHPTNYGARRGVLKFRTYFHSVITWEAELDV